MTTSTHTEVEALTSITKTVPVPVSPPWARLAQLECCDGKTLEEWIRLTWISISPELHYIASFARMARRGHVDPEAPQCSSESGRLDLRAWGGSPGMGANHLGLTFQLERQGASRAWEYNKNKISAYYRALGDRDWLLSWYRRFGMHEVDALGYFAYQTNERLFQSSGDDDADPEHPFSDIDHETLQPPASGGRTLSAAQGG